MYKYILSFAIIALTPNLVYAYIGPGLGLGIFALIAGFIISIFLALFGVVYYPLKKAFMIIKKKIKNGK